MSEKSVSEKSDQIMSEVELKKKAEADRKL